MNHGECEPGPFCPALFFCPPLFFCPALLPCVADILDMLPQRITEQTILADFADRALEDIRACLHFGAGKVGS